MAFIEKTTKIKDDEINFEEIVSFRTASCVGEWTGEMTDKGYGFIIFLTTLNKRISDNLYTIYASNLDELINEVENRIKEEIIEVYDRSIISLKINI